MSYQTKEQGVKVLKIKLKRAQVRACRTGRTSGSFSYSANIRGKEAIIYCTEGQRITDAFIGIVKKASRKSRNWVLAQVQELQLQ